ncbi:TPA: hypothetical protein ACPWIL_000620 [Pseudomonas aeruginosa]|uniref:hypothetical protein n=1 Tax=Pseudomonas aeruginosa TaxID=287 RepID=UPI002902A354|nr:hypothetical protein [Pseudomonas aeruginosa]MDU0535821.1 hypothetical protein [Pseudomonas aeruginosa]MEA8680049.1 hypothetical protein [Pseudomonas aeruginosa]MEA8693169.1 hypothetical protein [Pseudomonas aeruginosa]
MSEVHSITTEHLAGASALDGEELTLALLRENEDLIMQNKRLSKQRLSKPWLMFFFGAAYGAAVAGTTVYWSLS